MVRTNWTNEYLWGPKIASYYAVGAHL